MEKKISQLLNLIKEKRRILNTKEFAIFQYEALEKIRTLQGELL